MKYFFIFLTLFLIFSSVTCDKNNEQWISLFNGENLDGWIVKIAGHEMNDNYLNTFRVEDGVMKISYDEYDEFNGKFGHIFYNTPYSHYIIRVEYRFVDEQVAGGPGWAYRNNGIMLHSQSPESMGLDQNFPVSIEAQLLGGNGTDERTNGNVCTPGTHIVMDGKLITNHCTNSNSKTFHGDQWIVMEAEVRGDGKIIHRINGEVVLEYENPQLDEQDEDARKLITSEELKLKSGYIALQAESHPTEFRKIELLPLKQAKDAEIDGLTVI